MNPDFDKEDILMILDALDDKYAGRGLFLKREVRLRYKELCTKLHQELRKFK